MSRNDPEPLSVPGVEGRAVRARPARATLAAVTTLPYVDEPRDLRLAFNTPESLVKYPAIRTTPREAAIRQGGDLAKRVWAVWKAQLKPDGVTWQDFLSVSSSNRDASRAWADGEIPWRTVQEGLVERLNARTSAAFVLAG